MGRDQLEIRPTNFFVKVEVGRSAPAPPLRVLMKNSADKERIISDMGTEEKRLLRCDPGKSDEHVGDVLRARFALPMGRAQEVGAGKRFQKRRDIIAKFAIADSSLLQDVSREHVKIKLRRNSELVRSRQDGIDETGMIEHVVARVGVSEQIDQRHVIFLRTRQRAHDEIEIRGGKPRPAIRPDHRKMIMNNAGADDKRVFAKVTKKTGEALPHPGFVRAEISCSPSVTRRMSISLLLRLFKDSQSDCKL
jgi:hypothetical protein